MQKITSLVINLTSAILLISAASHLQAGIQFTETTNFAGSFGAGESWGSAWGDFNNDSYPDLLISNHRMMSSYYQNSGNGTFRNATADVDASYVWRDHPKFDTHGYTWADFDNDGDQDLFGAVSGNFDAQLLLNEGNVFNLVSRERNLYDDFRGRMGVWFDYTNDGLLDIGIPTKGFYLFRQDIANPGSFIKDTSTGLNCTNFHNYGQLLDVNNDGVLDFICGREGAFPNNVYDTSSIPFKNISQRIPKLYNVNDSTIHDFDGDLRNDIVVTRGRMRPNKAVIVNSKRIEAWLDSGTNRKKGFTFRSNGSLTFISNSHQIRSAKKIFIGLSGANPATRNFTVNPGEASGIKANQSTQGIYIGYDAASETWSIIMQPGNEMRGYFTVKNTATITNLKMVNVTLAEQPIKPEILFNKPNGFVKNKQAGFQEETCVSVASGDFDNDMDVDIYMVCRYGPENTANIVYENDGNGNFTRHVNSGANGALGKGLNSRVGTGENVSVVDYDSDGFLDLFVTNGLLMKPTGKGGLHQLFQNIGNNNNWIEIDLIGKGAGYTNRDAIGAKIYITANGKTQVREQNGGYHRWSQHHKRIHFGLANNDTVDIRAVWPTGQVDEYFNISSNSIYQVHENQTIKNLNSNISEPEVGVVDMTVNEGNGKAWVAFQLSKASDKTVTVFFVTQDLTAQNTHDYNFNVGSITFDPGQTQKSVKIPIINDNIHENREEFIVSINGAINATVARDTAIIAIDDDDIAGNVNPSCGEPVLDAKIDQGIFLWRNCVTNEWFVRFLAGNSSTTASYKGVFTTDSYFQYADGFDLESTDSLFTTTSQIDFRVNAVTYGIDGINFSYPTGSTTCFTLKRPLGLTAKLGINKQEITIPFDLETLKTCN